MQMTIHAMQSEKGSQEVILRDGQRWLDQAQGQLQNTQVALNDKEAECRHLKQVLEHAVERAESLEVHLPSNAPPYSAINLRDTIQCLVQRRIALGTSYLVWPLWT